MASVAEITSMVEDYFPSDPMVNFVIRREQRTPRSPARWIIVPLVETHLPVERARFYRKAQAEVFLKEGLAGRTLPIGFSLYAHKNSVEVRDSDGTRFRSKSIVEAIRLAIEGPDMPF